MFSMVKGRISYLRSIYDDKGGKVRDVRFWRRNCTPRAGCIVLVLAILAFFIWRLCEKHVLVFGCGPLSFFSQCVVVGRTDVITVLVAHAPPRSPGWCPKYHRGSAKRATSNNDPYRNTVAKLISRKACRLRPRANERVGSLNFGDKGPAALEVRRACVEWAYACDGGHNVTLWYHHFHKAGGSTFVKMAQANGAQLHRLHENGNPLSSATGKRIAFWERTPMAQAAWLGDQRRKHGTDTVVTEFGFPTSASLLAPLPVLYVTMIREPVARLVSSFFWRFHRHFAGQYEKRLLPGEPCVLNGTIAGKGPEPSFKMFAHKQTNFYVRMLSGLETSLRKPTPTALSSHKDTAANTLHVFSVILICEWLPTSAPLLARHLGWTITDFALFVEKENNARKDYSLIAADFGSDWRAVLKALNSLDVELYSIAQHMAADQLLQFGIEPPSHSPVGQVRAERKAP